MPKAFSIGFNPKNDDCGTNVNGLWKVEISNFACAFTME